MKLTTLHSGIDFKLALIGFSWGIYQFSDSGTKGLDLWLHFFPFFLHLEVQIAKHKVKSKIIHFPRRK